MPTAANRERPHMPNVLRKLKIVTSSVFGRLTGKRQTAEQQLGEKRLSPPLEVPAESDKSKLINGHKRESSILSLTSVTDLGHNVRRSVSLRSHRTQPSSGSGSGSGVFGHTPRFPSSGNLITSPLTTSPVEDEEPQSLPHPPSSVPPTPRRAKLSMSARSLSSKFKSTDNLPTLSQPGYLESTAERPTTAVEIPKNSHSSMLAAPAAPKRAPPDRPILHPQASFTRDISSSHGTNGISLQPPATVGSHNPQTIYQQIHETSAKRMATVEYLRKVHDGNIFYFGTWHYTPSSLQSIPSMHPLKTGRRANNYLVLGYSLPALLDLNSGSPLEYLKALSALLQEFETYQSLSGFDTSGNSISKGRMGQMLKSGMGLGNRTGKSRRTSTATESVSITTPSPDYLGLPRSATEATSPQEYPSPINASGHDFQYLVTPHLPFDADFNTTYATLCDTLIDTYGKLIDLVPSPDMCGPGVGEAFAKADKAIRKILVSNVMREFEDTTRANVKGEVAGLGKLVLGGLM
ncbi:hypothetical protein LTR37_010498 [Vermiconidia calcicola]|uniref:Uncharacterized protein n=1 Tax=Vermiconidia calcicola TaxID=1690605 RepID=A0ACC3N5Z1_9PEZI|nr:hypothetical protein LTR37_010498 [Vermiconidia calcicola]